MPNHLKKRVGTYETPENIARLFGGQHITDNPQIQEALRVCDLAWETLVIPICLSDKLRTKIPGFFGTYRKAGPSNNIPLGVVKTRYRPTHNRESFAWIDHVLKGNTKASIVAGGMFEEGKRVWVAVDLGCFTPITGDEIRRTMIVMNSNDGNANWTVHLIPTRLLGLTALNFHDSGGFYKIRHTSGALTKMSEIMHIMSIEEAASKAFEADIKLMAKTKINTAETDQLIYTSLGVDPQEFKDWYEAKVSMKQPQWVNQYEAIKEMMLKGPGQDIAPGTVWSLYTSICNYADYIRTIRSTKTAKDNVFESRMIGYSAKQKFEAYQVCSAFVKKPVL